MDETLREGRAGLFASVQQLAEAIPGAVFFKDATGTYRLCNGAYEKLVGLPRLKILGRRAREIFRPEEAAEEERSDQAAWVTGHVQGYGLPYQATDGSLRHGLCRKAVVRDAEGQAFGLIGIVADITDLIHAEEALRQSERWFRALSEHALDMVAVVDAAGLIRFVSPAVERVPGWTPAQLTGSSFYALVHPADAPEAREGIARSVSARPGEEQLVELRIRGRDDSGRTIEVIGKNRLNDPAVQGIVVNARDITQRRRAQDELRQSEERFRGVVESMPALLAAASAEFVPLLWNRECERVTGWKAEEIVGNPSAMRILIPDRASRRRLRDKHRAAGADFRDFEINVTCRDGSVRTISWSSLSGQFPVAGWAIWGVGRDVTAETQTRRAVAMASRLAAARLLSRGVAGNLESLAAAASDSASRLSAGTQNDDARASLADIGRASERAGRLARQLRAFAEEAPADGPANANESVGGGVEAAKAMAGRQDVAVEVDLDAGVGLLEVEASSDQVTQLAAYLVTNSLESISGSGEVRIGTRALRLAQDDPDTPATLRRGAAVRIRVEDSGCGIDPKIASRIFDPFFTTKEKGLGLGLTAVYGIVHQHGGAIVVEPRPAEGSIFSVYLPARPVGDSAAGRSARPVSG